MAPGQSEFLQKILEVLLKNSLLLHELLESVLELKTLLRSRNESVPQNLDLQLRPCPATTEEELESIVTFPDMVSPW